MAVRLLVAAAAAMCLAGAATATVASSKADEGRIAFATNRDLNLRRVAAVSVHQNGTGRRLVDIWPRGFPSFVPSQEGNRILFVREEGGRLVLFISGRKGEHARRLTPPEIVPDPRHGLAFSPDGKRIAFAGWCAGCMPGIFVVRSDGSRLRRIAVDARFPLWSPNGRRILYTGDMHRGPIRSIYVVGLDGKRPTRLGRGASPAWAPGGDRVAYVEVGQSNRSSFCVASIRRPRPRCFRGPRPLGVSWSPTGRHIALLGYPTRTQLAVVRPNGRGLRVVTRDYYSGFGWSADGRRVAFVSLRSSAHGIYLRNALAPGRAKLVARESPHASLGCCTFRRGRIRYWLRLDDNDHEIAVMNADGSGFRALTNNFDDDRMPAWSPDGETIAYSRLKIEYATGREPATRGSELRTVSANGTGDRLVTPSGPWHDTSPSWSPDGRRIAFVRSPLNGTEGALMILDLGNGTLSPVQTPWTVGLRGIAWSPDGRWISLAKSVWWSEDLSFVQPDGTGLYSIFAGENVSSPAWASDMRVAFSAGGYVVAVNADGTGRKTVARQAASPSWSPDSQRIAFVRTSTQDHRESDIWSVSASGGAEIQLTHDPSSNVSPAWGP
jgi:TolB protein